MIKFNNIPPTKPEDVEFLASAMEGLDDTEFDATRLHQIGENIGRQLLGHMSDNSIDATKTAVILGIELSVSHNAFQGFDAMQAYASGVVEGVYDEASAISMRRGQ